MKASFDYWAAFLTERVILLYFALCLIAMWVNDAVTSYEEYESSLATINTLLSAHLSEYGTLIMVVVFMKSSIPFFKGEGLNNALTLGANWFLFVARFSLLSVVSLFLQRLAIPAIASTLDSSDTTMTAASLLANDLLVVAILFIVIVRGVVKYTAGLVTVAASGEPMFAGISMHFQRTQAATQQNTISEAEFKIACQHEAGHIMTFAFLRALPPRLEMSMGEANYKGSLGRVIYSLPVSRIGSVGEREFEMLLSLGGIAAERHYSHHGLLGGSGDMVDWINGAKSYFSLGRDSYNVTPTSEFEHTENTLILDALQQKQFDLLALFFKRNSDQLERIWQEIAHHKKLAKNQIEFLLGPLSLEGMPSFDINHDPDSLKIIL